MCKLHGNVFSKVSEDDGVIHPAEWRHLLQHGISYVLDSTSYISKLSPRWCAWCDVSKEQPGLSRQSSSKDTCRRHLKGHNIPLSTLWSGWETVQGAEWRIPAWKQCGVWLMGFPWVKSWKCDSMLRKAKLETWLGAESIEGEKAFTWRLEKKQ